MAFYKKTFNALASFFNPFLDTYNATPDPGDNPIPVNDNQIVDENYLAIVDEAGNDIIWEQ